jgi:hypothetical protein
VASRHTHLMPVAALKAEPPVRELWPYRIALIRQTRHLEHFPFCAIGAGALDDGHS